MESHVQALSVLQKIPLHASCILSSSIDAELYQTAYSQSVRQETRLPSTLHPTP